MLGYVIKCLLAHEFVLVYHKRLSYINKTQKIGHPEDILDVLPPNIYTDSLFQQSGMGVFEP